MTKKVILFVYPIHPSVGLLSSGDLPLRSIQSLPSVGNKAVREIHLETASPSGIATTGITFPGEPILSHLEIKTPIQGIYSISDFQVNFTKDTFSNWIFRSPAYCCTDA